MECMYVKSFCCLFSVKTGTFLIVFLNLAFSFFGFIAWVSTGVILFLAARRDGNEDHNQRLFVLIYIGTGITLCMVQLLMGVMLMQGLRKEEPRYLKWHLGIGAAIILANIGTSIWACLRYQILTIIYPMTIGIPLQAYFLIVIRSAYREMMEDQRNGGPAPMRPDLSRSVSGQPVFEERQVTSGKIV